METELLLKKLEGVQTIDSACNVLKTSKDKTIYYLFRLRKEGYVKTKRLSNNKRVYNISFENKLKGTSYFEIINKYSPVKIATPITYKIYGKDPSLEETLVYAIKTGSLRTILASLALFKKITNWSELYQLSKKNRIERQVGALYDLAKKIMKVRSMPDRFRNNALPKKGYNFKYTIKGLKNNESKEHAGQIQKQRFTKILSKVSKDFKDIEETWKIYLPFNKNDLSDYK